ncbi:MAG: tRNA (guanosine(37)-N1)-methyltransferase TrmD [Limnochordales bacterium]|nr:tRNA (guanosine(37)-N1)-methyltransferase TrmD [Limnochordales bacterium]
MPLRVDVVTLFPQMLAAGVQTSIVGRALQAGHLTCRLWNLREFGVGKHRLTDDVCYGGGVGMVMRPEPFFRAVEAIRRDAGPGAGEERVVLFGPAGRRLTQEVVEEFARVEHLILLCGHYEGVDERVRQLLATDEISLGDFVLTGGEIPALALIDAVTRLLPGVLPEGATEEESFSWGILEYPQYTRPPVYHGVEVPTVLRQGNREQIRRWRRQEALRRTWRHRPDLLQRFRQSRVWKDDPQWEMLLEQVRRDEEEATTE